MEPDSQNIKQQPTNKFSIPVDNENKATEFHPLSISSPHMRAFHLAWLSLFACFFSTFSIPPLIPVIRRDLNLSPTDIGNAGIASFAGSIFSRLTMGPICDLMGPRISSATLSLLTAPVILLTSVVTSSTSFILIRFLVGFTLANFVANQFWMSLMFSGCVVGLANGVAAGWANVGGGVAQLVMPQIYSLLNTSMNLPSAMAWRVSFFVPATFQAITGILVLIYGQDLPTGYYINKNKNSISNTCKRPEDNFFRVVLNGLSDYRGWILGFAYGYSFGSELTTDNIIAQYFYDRFGVNLQVAGMIAASFGMANFFSRPMGGVLSDWLAKMFGVKGRVWGLWGVQTLAGLLCILLGRVTSLLGSVVVMCLFSVFVQAASGLTFGVVPFISTRSLGVIAGMTGSGGAIGAVVTQFLFFSGTSLSRQTGISLMGVMIMFCSLPVTFISFPHWNSTFCGPTNKISVDQEAEEHYRLLA